MALNITGNLTVDTVRRSSFDNMNIATPL